MKELLATVRPALVALLAFTGLCGVAYPLVVGGLAAVVPHPAPASLVGQPFADPGYFWSRPSAIGYRAMTSGGTNLGPTSPALVQAVADRVAALRAADPGNRAKVPVDLVTASASGLDPDLSPAAAYYQLGRVARVRGLPEATVRALVDRQIEERTLGLLGERRVNVVRLNRALDRLSSLRQGPAPAAAAPTAGGTVTP
jgi:K+-transporting ATPase ATPase C chain